MLKFHKIMFMVGCIFTALGLLGLPALMMKYETIGKILLLFAPLGAILMFTGLVVIVMLSPSEKHETKMPD